MSTNALRHICRGLAATLFVTSLGTAHAQAAYADAYTAPIAGAIERPQLHDLDRRAAIVRELQARGVDDLVAKERVAALTDEEADALARGIEGSPAGGFVDGGVVAAGLAILALFIVGIVRGFVDWKRSPSTANP
jgi:hypothetical protein